MKKFITFIEANARGILGTLIFHLILLNVFFMMRMSAFKADKHEEIVIEFQELDENQELLPIDKKAELIENELSNLEQDLARNVAVNKANNKLAEEISTENYINNLKEELNIDELFPDRDLDKDFFPELNTKKQEKEISTETREYAGPTRIEYYLKDRTKQYIHIPVYKCEGSGKITLSIVVDRKGYVIQAEVLNVQGNTSDKCLIDAAIDAAKRSRFNTDYNAVNRQKGSISYQFVAQ